MSKLKVKKFLWLISTFTEKAEEKLVGRGGSFDIYPEIQKANIFKFADNNFLHYCCHALQTVI